MAYDDALFQLGMDLTRSSTAQKEDLFETAPTCNGQSNSISSGRSIILDLIGAREFTSAKAVENALRVALSSLKSDSHEVTSGHKPHRGCDWMSVSAHGGRVHVEAWPDTGFFSVDLTGTSLRPESAMVALANAFGAREAILRPTKQASLATRYAKQHARKTSEPVRLSRHANGTARASQTAKAA